MPEMGGMDLLAKPMPWRPELPVIFLTGYGTIPDAVKALKAGVVDYLTKPFEVAISCQGPGYPANASAASSSGSLAPLNKVLTGGKSPACESSTTD